MIFCVSSQGGHWLQMQQLTSQLGYETVYVKSGRSDDNDPDANYYVSDWSRNNIWRAIACAWQLLFLILKFNPKVIITTGAAPGLLAILLGSVLCKKTIWVDSVANAEKLSMSGSLAAFIASHCLTQWEHLADNKRVFYIGTLL